MTKILIVDDSPTQRHSLRQIVEQGGHQTVVAESGERALEMVSNENPTVILMDVVMPGMSGYQATRRLSRSKSTSHIPVIFVTSCNNETDRVWGMRQGARGYLTKPVNAQSLLSAITAAMAA